MITHRFVHSANAGGNLASVSLTQCRWVPACATFLAVAIAVLLGGAIPSHASSINYGNFNGSTVMYTDVTESSAKPLPLYGAPTLVGDSLFFSPQQFFAESNGNVPPIDSTDGQLTFKAMAKAGNAITGINFDEAGAFDVTGFAGTTDATMASVIVVGYVSVLEIDGNSNIVPYPIPIGLSFAFTPFGGSTVVTNQWKFLTNGDDSGSWAGSQSMNITQTLVNAGYQLETGATKIAVNLDNRLRAKSETTGYAYIDKKLFLEIATSTPVNPPVPEPAAAVLMGIGLLGLILRRGSRPQ
jgi:PEP-CTERM motif